MTKKSSIHQFPVGNGDMTLLKIASNDTYYTILTDMHLRQNGQDDDDKCDALTQLHNVLELDDDDRPYVDVLLLSHPDEDHILGYSAHFHTGKLSDYKLRKDREFGKIVVREIWSSPIISRRKSKNHPLCKDAIAFNTEAKRRVQLYRDNHTIADEGDRIRLICHDADGKTDDIPDIVYHVGTSITSVNEIHIPELTALILAPLSDDDYPEDSNPDKNRSSVVIQWAIASHGFITRTNHILLAGDAGVDVWEILWDKHQNAVYQLQYDILLAPHHCSWRTLSHDSYSENDDPKVSENALSALGQAKPGAIIVASSNAIKKEESDPPNYQAMQEYEAIVTGVDGTLQCLANHMPSKGKAPEVLSHRLTNSGPQVDSTESAGNKGKTAAFGIITSGLSGEALPHG